MRATNRIQVLDRTWARGAWFSTTPSKYFNLHGPLAPPVVKQKRKRDGTQSTWSEEKVPTRFSNRDKIVLSRFPVQPVLSFLFCFCFLPHSFLFPPQNLSLFFLCLIQRSGEGSGALARLVEFSKAETLFLPDFLFSKCTSWRNGKRKTMRYFFFYFLQPRL